MAYRANLFDFGAVAGSAGGANAATNDAAIAAAMASPTKIIEVEAEKFEFGTTIKHDAQGNGKSFRGVNGHDVFGGADFGTVFEYWGSAGGTMLDISPSVAGPDLTAPCWDGFHFRGRGITKRGISSGATRQGGLFNCKVSDMAQTSDAVAVYLGSSPLGDVRCTYTMLLHRMVANVDGAAHGIMADGAAGQGNTTFCTFFMPRVVHKNGVAFYLGSCDDNIIINAGVSCLSGGIGAPFLIDGNRDWNVGNSVYGFHAGHQDPGVSPVIQSRGSKARQNRMYSVSGVDNQPTFSITSGSEMYFDYNGGGYGSTLASEKALVRMPKRQELTY